MIAVTDISSLTDLDADAAPSIIALTKDAVNQIPATGIINATITQAVKNILNSILSSTSSLNIADARSSVATYAGFRSQSDGTVTFSSANVSLDKLTFYVIFRLPFANSALQYENPLTESSAVPGATAVSWGKYANYIRGLTGSGILRINSAGEQVNVSNQAVDDNSNVIDGWFNEAAYNFLGEHPFNTSVTVPPGLYSSQTEKAMLFGQNTDVPNGPGVQPLPITKIPLYFYLLAKVENPYNEIFWLNPSKDSATISRVCHWPARVNAADPRKHFVKLNPASDSAITNGSYTLLSDNGGSYFMGTVASSATKQKLYIVPMDIASLAFENLTLSTANFILKTDDGYLAAWNNKSNAPGLTNNSGLTSGLGVDIGAGLNGIYSIQITMTITGPTNGTFRLYCGGVRTGPINAKASNAEIKKQISSLIDSPDRTTVVKDPNNPAAIIVKIKREYSSNNKAYNHRIYVSDLVNGTTVTMSPQNEIDRWVEQQDQVNDSYYFLSQYLGHSFSNNPANLDDWLNHLGTISNTEKDQLKTFLKRSSGCRSKAGYYIWDENKVLLKKIEFKSYVQNLRSVYNYIFLPRYYEKTRTIGDGTTKNNAPGVTVRDLLNNPKLKTTPNQAELFAIVLLNYNFPGLYKKKIDKLIEAINSHSKKKLADYFAAKEGTKHPFGMSADRIMALNSFMGPTVTAKLYHGLND